MLLVVLLLLEAIFLHIKSVITAELFTAGSVAFAKSQCFFFQPWPNQSRIGTHDWELKASSFRADMLLWCSSQVESPSPC